MPSQLDDSWDVRAELRTLSRASLLVIAERAAELIPADRLSALLGDFVKLEAATGKATFSAAALLDDVREFFDSAVAGHYYEAIEINNRGRQEQSAGSDAFAAEFDRLVRRCTHAADDEEFVEVRDSVELLLALLRSIDPGNDDILFFTDESGSSNVGINWRSVLRTYFECLAATASPAEFSSTVVSTIEEFVSYDRPHYLAAAHVVSNEAQRSNLNLLILRFDAERCSCENGHSLT